MSTWSFLAMLLGTGMPGPLVDIQNTRKIEGVMARGRWFDRTALDNLLKQVEQAANSNCRALSPH